jgi:two-component system chemotaxis response regulator CheY
MITLDTTFAEPTGFDFEVKPAFNTPQKNLTNPTILIVDDEFPIRRLLEFFLTPKYTVIAKSNVPEAMNWLNDENVPDAIILDIEMPLFNGKDFLKIIREEMNLLHIPIIMLSGNEKTTERIECLNLGADDYLVKPFNPQELEVRINNLFKRRQRFL